jgi:hypothetical protein
MMNCCTTPNYGRVWKSLMTAYFGDDEKMKVKLKKTALNK